MKHRVISRFFYLTMILALVLSPSGAFAKSKDGTSTFKHSASSKKKKSKNKGTTIKVEDNSASKGPMEDISNQTEVSQEPAGSKASDKGKSKKK